MAKKTVISKVLDAEAVDGIIEFPQNETLYVDQFTVTPPCVDEERYVFRPQCLDDVFEHYSPCLENLYLEAEDGTHICETFYFKSIEDFSEEGIIRQSVYLSELNHYIITNKNLINSKGENIVTEESNKDLEKAESSLRNNLSYIHKEIRNIVKSYLSLDLYFKNCDNRVNHLSILNVDRTKIGNNKSKDTLLVCDELECMYNRLSLRGCYSFLVIPGYIESGEAIKMWATIAYRYKVILITDFKDSLDFDSLCRDLDKEPLHGNVPYLSNAVILCNYVRGNYCPILASGYNDLYLPSSVAFAGRIINSGIKMFDASCGLIDVALRGVQKVRIKDFDDAQVHYLTSVGINPVVHSGNGIIVFSNETLGKLTFPQKRAIDWLTKVIQNFICDEIFRVWNQMLKYELLHSIHDFMNAHRLPDGFIADYNLKEISQDVVKKECNVKFSIKLFDCKNEDFDIDLIGKPSTYGIDWHTNIS